MAEPTTQGAGRSTNDVEGPDFSNVMDGGSPRLLLYVLGVAAAVGTLVAALVITH
jgi:hypothetical protein